LYFERKYLTYNKMSANYRARIANMRTVNQVQRALEFAYNWENNALGFGNSRAAPPSRQQWADHTRYKNMLTRRLWALQAAQRNRPRRPARAARVIQKKFKQVFYTPNNNGNGLRGRGYRMAMARRRGTNPANVGPRERLTRTLKAKLANLRRQTNRGAMVNIYNGMYNKWMNGGGVHGANIMNNAQRIMSRARLIM
jgi:hypothetical protein